MQNKSLPGCRSHKRFIRTLRTFTITAAFLFSFRLAVAGDERPNVQDAYGPAFHRAENFRQSPQRQPRAKENDSVGRVRYWNEVAFNASGLDHTPVAPGENRVFGEQFGPCRAARAMAIVQIAVFDAVNVIKGSYQCYTGLRGNADETSLDAAIAQAAHDTLVAMFPSQRASFDSLLADDLAQIESRPAKQRGIALGRRAAAAILKLRADDGSDYVEPRLGIEYFASTELGHWQQDPISKSPIALGAYWGSVTPFVLESGQQFRIPPPPDPGSAEFAEAYAEVKRLGGDGVTTPTQRTPEQTFIGIYWAYDGTPSLCAPPRMYNQITVHVAQQMHTSDIELARLLALANTAMADAGIASWESKFFYDMWRPVTAIRAYAPPVGDPNFTPLGAPASNLNGPNFTPPFPACPSGHATFGGAVFQTLRRFYGTDRIAFTFVSDELNGVTQDNQGNVRPLRPRSFPSLSAAEEENGQSRICLGIHWAFDKTDGIAQGRKVGNYVFDNAFQPVRASGR